MAIYLDEADRLEFLALLAKVVREKQVVCYGYCLMGNHYHAVIATTNANLSSALKQLNRDYARWWNDRHGHVGHVFQGRFNAQIIEDDTYLITACTYDVLNPVRAGLVELPEQWRWSSHRATAGLDAVPPFLSPRALWERLGPDSANRYREHVAAALGTKLSRDPILGDAAFVQRFAPWRERASREVPLRERLVRPPLPELFVGANDRPALHRAIAEARAARYRVAEIAEHLGVHERTIFRASGKGWRHPRGVEIEGRFSRRRIVMLTDLTPWP
jgi:REP element-mobilizing transposase RayT